MPATAPPPPTLVDPADLIGLNDVAEILGVKLSMAHYYASREGFPEPVTTVGRSRIWTRPAVAGWVRERASKPEAS